MNTNDRDDDRDPVADFFGRERDRITAHDGSDLHWQSIVRQARAQRRSRFLGSVAGVAAAGLVIGGITYGAVLRGGTAPVTAATQAATTPDRSASATAAAKAAAAAAARTAADAKAAAEQALVLKSFAALSITNVGQGSIFVLGSSGCGSGRCPSLLGSTDDGRTWHLVNTFKTNAPPTASKPGVPKGQGEVQAADVLSQVRFANAKVGWVFGSDVQYTTDGGKTFRPYDHLGAFVTDVETDGSQVVVASADGCANTVCDGARHVARAGITAPGATAEIGSGPASGDLEDLRVVFDATTPYVSPRWRSAPKSGFEPMRITAGGLEVLGPPGGTCADANEHDLIATADPRGGLLAFCPAVGGGAAGSLGMAVSSSTNQGMSWSAVSSDALILVNSGSRSFAAANAQDLLAVSGGDPAIHGSMKISHDGGKSWRSPGSAPPMPPSGWAWVGAPGGKTFYALSGDAVPAFWKSDDSGETWTRVDLTS
jgi:hypothetical protein